jgi:hypothetical protein
MLSGTGSLAASAGAAEDEHWLAQLSISSSKELSKKQTAVAWARLARGRHLRGLLSSGPMSQNQAAERIRTRMLSAARTGVAAPPDATIKGVRHQLRGGGRLLALVYQEGNAMVVSYRLDKPDQATRMFSRVLENEGDETLWVLAGAEDGDVFSAPQHQIGRASQSRARTCRSRGDCGRCYTCTCVSYNFRCFFNCCAPCALTCAAGLWVCVGCVAAYCPLCLGVNACCNRKECRVIKC